MSLDEVAAMELRVSLLRQLEHLFEDIGWSKPQAVLEGCGKFVISVDICNMPMCSSSSSVKNAQVFIGDDQNNSSIAEHKAVMAVKKFLAEAFCLEIHDLSHSKIKNLESKIVEDVMSLNSSSSRLHRSMKDYQTAVNLLSPFLSNNSDNPDTVFTEIEKELSDLINVVQPPIASIMDQLSVLDGELTLHCSSGSSIQYNASAKTPPLVGKSTEKHLLTDILHLLELPAAKFDIDYTEFGMYIATCTILGSNPSETIRVASEAKFTQLEAENSAAALAITSLEQSKSFVTVDFNYDDLCQLQQKHEKFNQLRLKHASLTSQSLQCWSQLARLVQKFSSDQHGLSMELYRSNDPFAEFDSVSKFAWEFDLVLYQVWNMQENAVSAAAAN